MRRIGNALSYSNVVATLALFLALGGGVVYAASNLGKNSVKSKNIAASAVKTRNLAKNAVTTGKVKKDAITSGKVKKGTLGRSDLAANTLAGLQVADVSAAAVPGLNVEQPGGTPVPLTGSATFTPVPGKSYELLVELRGTPIDADGPNEGTCGAFVEVLVNGVPANGARIWQNVSGQPPFNNEPFGTSSAAIALQAATEPQTLTALSLGDSGCSPSTAASLRAVVVQFG
jgi:hypothetical protein